jgi:hypothetical protein
MSLKTNENNKILIENMLKNLSSMSIDIKKKKIEIEKTKKFIKENQKNYNKELKKYNDLNKECINYEEKREKIYNEISKNLKKNQIFISNINKNFISNLFEIKFDFINNFMKFCGFKNNNFEIFKLCCFKNENEFKILLNNSIIYQQKLFILNNNLFNNIKNEILNIQNVYFPFDNIYDFMKITYKNIQLENEKNILNINLNHLNHQKNSIFIGLKNLEGTILKSNKNVNKIKFEIENYNFFLEEFQKIKKKNNNINNIINN